MVNHRALIILLLMCGALLATALSRLQLTYDLGFFLPAPQSDEQRVLIERLGQGPGTQLVFVALPNTNETKAAKAAQQLRELPGITRVLPELREPGLEDLPDVLWQHRLQLADLPTTKAGWLKLLDERMSDLMLADDDLQNLIASDPALLSLHAIEKASNVTSSPEFLERADEVSGRAEHRYLLIQTSSGAFDLDAQTTTIKNVRSSLLEAGLSTAKLYGSGVYGVDLQASVQRESIVFSVLASFALAALVFFRFRSWLLVLAIGVPLLVGGLAGLAVLSLLFSNIHGITLAFGFTLLGVAIDYPLHLFSQSTSTGEPQRVWPTLRLGIASTLVAYLAFALSGTAGMQQLGVFAVTGIVSAALASWWLTRITTDNQALVEDPTQHNPEKIMGHPNHLPWCLCLLLGLPLTYTSTLFSDDLSRLTPIPQAILAEDARIRQAMGVADLRHIVSVRDNTLQGTLERLEKTNLVLDKAIHRGDLSGFQNITPLLPSDAAQHRRQLAARELIQNGNFDTAIAESDFSLEALDPFKVALESLANNTTALLTIEQLRKQSQDLSNLIDSMLYKSGEQWVAMTFLRGLPATTNLLATELENGAGATLVDLKQASMTLVAEYRTRVFGLLGGALGAIALLLLGATRQPARVIWLLGTLLAALVLSIAISRLLLGGLSLFDVIALALVAGLGLDYALFFSKHNNSQEQQQVTRRAITLCALSSLFVFGVLALSSIPLLRGLGVTVASGVAAAWLLARFGWRQAKDID